MKKTKASERQKNTGNKAKGFDEPLNAVWNAIKWKKIQKKVYKLQKNIYKASTCGDVRKVRKLQKTLLRSWSAKVLAVRTVTQDNRGKRTAGIDGVKLLNPVQRLELAESLKVEGKATATRRVWIPKANGERRPLGIPTMKDRALQALVKLALEPEWEAKFEPNSYGFRPARRCQDAIQLIKQCIQHKPKFVLDADIAKCFDRIDHQKLLTKTGLKGGIRRQLKAWLSAGVMDKETFAETESGTPQGGVVSPLLANIALHGMETAVRLNANKGIYAQKELNFIRYADDFVVLHKDKAMIEKCKETIKKWLSDIGLELKPEKTRLTHTLETQLSEDGVAGFDFLGFHIQQHKAGKHRCSKNLQGNKTGYVTLINPTKKRCKVHQEKLGEIVKKVKNVPQGVLIKRLNPVITGWMNYYQYSDIKTVQESSKQDYLTYSKLRSWAKRRCKGSVNKGYVKYWHDRKYTMLNGNSSIRKEFACGKEANRVTLKFHSDTECSSTSYVKVQGNRSPFDGDLAYWGQRLQSHPELSTREINLLKIQKGKCSGCGLHFSNGDVMEVDHIIPKSKGGKDRYDNLQLLHGHCHDTKTKSDGSSGQRKNQLKGSKKISPRRSKNSKLEVSMTR